MKKNIFFVILVSFVIFVNSFFCYAEQIDVNYEPGWYKIDDVGWIYLKDNHEFAKKEWLWINKSNADNLYRHYYFNDFGFLEYNTLTPDGKWVNSFGEEEVNGTVLLAHDGLGNVYTMDQLKIMYPQLNNNPEVLAHDQGKNNVIRQVDINNSGNTFDTNKFPEPQKEESLYKKSYNSVFLEYRLKMVNRTVAYVRMVENEFSSFDVFNGRLDEAMQEYKSNITKIFDEGIEQIALLNQDNVNDTLSIQESNNYIIFMQNTYDQCMTKLKDAINVVKNKK